MSEPDRDFLEEARRILRGDSLLQPQIEHLRALNDSRTFWRQAATLHQQVNVVLTPPAARRSA
jgi:hypothetical protein